jgi:hypothetical protein
MELKKCVRFARAQAALPQQLAHLGKVTNIDFRRFDLNKPLPHDVPTDGHQQTLDEFRRKYAGKILREAMTEPNVMGPSVDIGRHAKQWQPPDPAEVEDGLVPALQDRGLVRAAYTHRHFRDNLLEF